MKREHSALEEDSTGSFFAFQKLCEEVGSIASYTQKTAALKSFFAEFTGDVYICCKLLLCKQDLRKYHIADKAVCKIFASVMSGVQNPKIGESAEELLDDLSKTGDASKTCSAVWKRKAQKWSSYTLKDVDDFLETLTQITKKNDQIAAFSEFLENKATSDDVKWLIRLIRQDLWINIGPKYVLGALHPNAFSAYKKSNNLQKIIQKIQIHGMEEEEDDDEEDEPKKKLKKAFSEGISLGTPIKPMLAKASKSFEDAVKRSPNGMRVEVKYDGERLQIHKEGDKFSIYSRNLKIVPEWKVQDIKEYLPKSTAAKDIILDGEILLIDRKTSKPLPFGSFNVHKQEKFADANPCFFVFDILSLEQESLLEKTFDERRGILEKNVNVIEHRIHLSELHKPSDQTDLSILMKTIIHQKLEGLIIKDAKSVYKPASRGWLKMKKDYLDDGAMADSADLIVLGSYYGTGEKGGVLSTLLLGVYDSETKKYLTVCKCGNGMSDEEIKGYQDEWKQQMKPCNSFESIDPMFQIDRKHVPDMIVKDPTKSQIFEIAGAEFTVSSSHPTGISIRFPRFVRLRDDKDHKTATTFAELKQLFETSKTVNEEEEAAAPKKKAKQASPKKKTTPKKKKKNNNNNNNKMEEDDEEDEGEVIYAESDEEIIEEVRNFKVRQDCKYGAKCNRVNDAHFKQYAHKDKLRPICKYGYDCNRQRPSHFSETMHPDEYQ